VAGTVPSRKLGLRARAAHLFRRLLGTDTQPTHGQAASGSEVPPPPPLKDAKYQRLREIQEEALRDMAQQSLDEAAYGAYWWQETERQLMGLERGTYSLSTNNGKVLMVFSVAILQ